MPYHFNSFVYKLNKKKDVEIILDIRESYSSPDRGRYYEIFEEEGKIIIKYGQEDGFEAYLAISSDLDYEKIERWFKQYYSYDKKRNSEPYEKYVYSALKIRTDKIIFTFSKIKEEAITENDFVLKQLKNLEEKQKNLFKKLFINNKVLKRIKDKELFFAYLSTINSLENLIITNDNSYY